MENKRNIVIVGGGFGGITAALKLGRNIGRIRDFEIILVDKNPYHLYTPALYEIAAIPDKEARAPISKSILTIPLEDIMQKSGVRFLRGELTALDKEKRMVEIKDHRGPLPYHFLILALGSETNYFNIPGIQEHSYPLKTFPDAVRLRNRIEELVKTRDNLAITVGGGGSTGVELAAELINFIGVLKEQYTKEKICDVTVTILEGSPEILPGFAAWLVKRSRARLEKLGVIIKTATRVLSVTPEKIVTDSGEIPCHLFIWAGGVRVPGVVFSLGLPQNPKGQIAVNEFLEAGPGIYAIGDNAGFIPALPRNVPVAEGEARHLAKNIIRELTGHKKRPFRPMSHYPYILAVGKKYAVADLVLIRFWGILGWIAKLLVELRYLLFILPLRKAIRVWVIRII